MGRRVGWGFAGVIFGVLVTVADPSLTGGAPVFTGAVSEKNGPISQGPVMGA